MMLVVNERIVDLPPEEVAEFCLRCGYDLRGTPAGANCPECGRVFVPVAKLTDADPAWLARVEKAGRGLLLLFTFPIILFQSGSAMRDPTGIGVAFVAICAIFVVHHLRAARILSGDLWLERADDESLKRRSMLLTFSWLLFFALVLIAAATALHSWWLLATGLAITFSAPVCARLDFQFIAAIAIRIPDPALAARARKYSMPAALGLAGAFAIYAAQVLVGRFNSALSAIIAFVPLIPVLIYSSRVTNAFAQRLRELRNAANAKPRRPIDVKGNGN